MSTKRPASGGESALAVSAWPLRRKVALALTIPLLLAESARDGRLVRGKKVAMVAFGSGFTWGAAIVDW